VLRLATDRSVREVRSLPPARGVRRAVLELWAASTTGQLQRCQRLYVEASALGLLGREPYVSVVREANEDWMRALADHLVAAGCGRAWAPRAANLLDAAMMGLQLDLPLDRGTPTLERSVSDLADAVATVAGAPPRGRRA
jgi:hypothetical protein